MKTNHKTPKAFIAALVAVTLALNVSSCKNDSSGTTPSTNISEADAAQFASDAVTSSTGGMVTQVSNSAVIYPTVQTLCGVQKDTTIVGASAAGATPSYNFNLLWNYTLSCDGAIPSMVTYNLTGSSTYDGVFMSSTGNSTGTFVLTGLQASATSYTLNSTFSRAGTAISKIGNKNTFTSTVKITGTTLAVDKTTHEILSGTATVTVTTVSTSGRTNNYGGTIKFLGNKTATLVLNSGVSYPISWS